MKENVKGRGGQILIFSWAPNQISLSTLCYPFIYFYYQLHNDESLIYTHINFHVHLYTCLYIKQFSYFQLLLQTVDVISDC